MRSYKMIRTNIDRIQSGFSEEKYPTLCSIFNNPESNIKQQLLFVLNYFKDNKALAGTGKGNEHRWYWVLPWNTVLCDCPGSATTIQSHLIFLTLTGFLDRIKPNNGTTQEAMRQAYLTARQNNKEPMVFYSCRLYKIALLKEAESIAKKIKDSGISITRIQKEDVARIFGNLEAWKLYQRKIENTLDSDIVIKFIKKGITEKGYTTKDAVFLDMSLSGQKPPRCTGKQFEIICKDAGFNYHRATKDECLQFGLVCGCKIVTYSKE